MELSNLANPIQSYLKLHRSPEQPQAEGEILMLQIISSPVPTPGPARLSVEAELQPHITYLANCLKVSRAEVAELVLQGLPSETEARAEAESANEVEQVSTSIQASPSIPPIPQTSTSTLSRLAELARLGSLQAQGQAGVSRNTVQAERAALNWESRRVLQELAFEQVKPFEGGLAMFVPTRINRLCITGYLVFSALKTPIEPVATKRYLPLHQKLRPQLPALVRVVLPNSHQTPGDDYVLQRPVQVFVQKVARDQGFLSSAALPITETTLAARGEVTGTQLYGLRVKVSRTDRSFVKALFLEVVPQALLGEAGVFCVERVPGERVVVNICKPSSRLQAKAHQTAQAQKSRLPEPQATQSRLSGLLTDYLKQLQALLGKEKLEINYY